MYSPSYLTPLPLYGSGGRKPRMSAATWPTSALSAPLIGDSRRAFDLDRDALGRHELDRVRVAELQHQLLAVHLRAVAGADDLQRLAEARRHAGHHVLDVRAHRAERRVARDPLGRDRASPSSTVTVVPSARAGSSSPFGPLTRTRASATATVTPLGIATGSFPDSRHGPLPTRPGDELAAEARLAGLAVGHQPARRGHDRRAQAAHDARDRRCFRRTPGGPACSPA